ncbi:MAG: sulfurtransferase TusA family protein [archaeon]|nr:sulfurtransferase TusA family protein [archaeon]MCP8306061.1 sulfurtransferase TusA family protein [archaeon]
MYKVDIEVDAKYSFCPGPLLKLFEAAKKAKPGQIIKLLATDPAAPDDVKNWAESIGHEFLNVDEKGEVYEIYVKIIGS